MKKGVASVIDIVSRYSILIISGILNTTIFYLLFTLTTIYPVYFLLKIFFDVSLSSSILLINNSFPINLIGPCIAASAYYLLLILNLSTPNIKIGKRIGILFFSFLSLLLVNILRIFSLSVLFVSGTSFFDLAHKAFWYVGSVLFVVGIWFLSVKLFKIEKVPFYSDIAFLLSHSRKNFKKPKRSNKH